MKKKVSSHKNLKTHKKTAKKAVSSKREKTDLEKKKRSKKDISKSTPKRSIRKKSSTIKEASLERASVKVTEISPSEQISELVIEEAKISFEPEVKVKSQPESEVLIKEQAPSVPLEKPLVEEKKEKEIEIDFPIMLKDLAIKLQEKPSVLIKTFMDIGKLVTINHSLDEEEVKLLSEKLGFKVKRAPTLEEKILSIHEKEDLPQELIKRPPVVTFMGHVDHGKTSLLDAIRKTKVAESEYGGITQHIGAYQVKLPQGTITFLDTPGHEAFTAMRARGAKATDIVVLVVAADEGVMPQTIEAIDHAKEAGVSIIVAINKIDKPQADIDKVKRELQKLGLTAEDWGGKTITVAVSAKTGQGIEELLEMILLEAEMLELKANPNRPAQGVVIEAKMTKEKGPICTFLVQKGTLKLNDYVIVGSCFGKVRAMFNEHGENLASCGPSTPVEVLGIDGVPPAGEKFYVVEDEKTARQVVEIRREIEKQKQILPQRRLSLEALSSQIKEGTLKELKLILKADTQGSLEAIKEVISKFDTKEIKVQIIHQGVGNVNPSDVILAVASQALILGFNVNIEEKAKELTQKEAVEIRIYNVIYELANEVKQALEGMLSPKIKKVFLGRVQVRKIFKLSKGTVAGCFVLKGKAVRSAQISVIRNGETVFEGKLTSLKRFKDDVREVQEGYECGISIDNFEDWQEGDIIEVYELEKIARKLEEI